MGAQTIVADSIRLTVQFSALDFIPLYSLLECVCMCGAVVVVVDAGKVSRVIIVIRLFHQMIALLYREQCEEAIWQR